MANGITSSTSIPALVKPDSGRLTLTDNLYPLIDAINGNGRVGRTGEVSKNMVLRRVKAWITGNQQVDSNFQWYYSLAEVAKTDTGYGTAKYKAVDNGLTCDASDSSTRAYHYAENLNAATGITGSDINIDNLPAGVAIKPVGNNVLVWVDEIVIADDNNTIEYWFERISYNSADGSCSA